MRFYGNHPGTRQERPFRHGLRAPWPERWESMVRELQTRLVVYGPGSLLVEHQLGVMEREAESCS